MSEENVNNAAVQQPEDARILKKRIVGLKSRNTTLQKRVDALVEENSRLIEQIKAMNEKNTKEVESKEPWYKRLFK